MGRTLDAAGHAPSWDKVPVVVGDAEEKTDWRPSACQHELLSAELLIEGIRFRLNHEIPREFEDMLHRWNGRAGTLVAGMVHRSPQFRNI